MSTTKNQNTTDQTATIEVTMSFAARLRHAISNAIANEEYEDPYLGDNLWPFYDYLLETTDGLDAEDLEENEDPVKIRMNRTQRDFLFDGIESAREYRIRHLGDVEEIDELESGLREEVKRTTFE